MTETLAIQRIEKHLLSPQVKAQFVSVLDKSAEPYIRSVLLAVGASTELQKCSAESISIAALRAASLQLSCDPAVKQAYLLPVWNGKKQCLEAQFQPHYLGLYAMAVRTNKYSVINVVPFPEGYDMIFDVSNGDYVIVNEEGKPVVFAPKVKPEEAGAWFGYLRTTRGFSTKVWMSKQQIHDHAKRFNSKGYNANGSLWKNPNQVPTMEKKTVLRELLNWADKSGYGDPTLREALRADDAIDAESVDSAVEEGTVIDEPATEETKREPAQEEEQKEDAQKYRYNSDQIVQVIKKIASFSNEEAAAAAHQAQKAGKISKDLTIAEAEAFARTLVPELG